MADSKEPSGMVWEEGKLRPKAQFTAKTLAGFLENERLFERCVCLVDGDRDGLLRWLESFDDEFYKREMPWASGAKREMETRGMMLTLGSLGGMPVCFEMNFARFGDVTVCAMEGCSMVVDHRLRESFTDMWRACVKKRLGTDPVATNLSNMHHFTHEYERLAGALRPVVEAGEMDRMLPRSRLRGSTPTP